MFHRGTRGGNTQAVYQYVWANNKYMGDRFDPTKESHYFEYFDADNLYSWVMSQCLPSDGFRWVEKMNKLKKHISWSRMRIRGSHCNRQFDKTRIFVHSPSQQQKKVIYIAGNRY